MGPRQYLASMPPVTTAFRKSSSITGQLKCRVVVCWFSPIFANSTTFLQSVKGVGCEKLLSFECYVGIIQHRRTCKINLSTWQIFVDFSLIRFKKKNKNKEHESLLFTRYWVFSNRSFFLWQMIHSFNFRNDPRSHDYP